MTSTYPLYEKNTHFTPLMFWQALVCFGRLEVFTEVGLNKDSKSQEVRNKKKKWKSLPRVKG